MEVFLSPKERDELLKVYKLNRDGKVSRRAHVILLLNKGFTSNEISKICFLDDQTIRRLYNIYKDQGIEVLLSFNYKGSSCSLSDSQLDELTKHLRNTIYPTAKAVCNFVLEKYKLKYSEKGMVKLLKRLGFEYKKPRLIPGKIASVQEQKQFVEKYKDIKKNLGENDKIFFMDGVHPQHNTKPAYGWIYKGSNIQLQSNTGRKRININAAISIDDMQLVSESYETINSDAVIDTLGKIIKNNPKAKTIHVFSDNAAYCRSNRVKDFVKTSVVNLIFIPPYSPNLNLIERLWKLLHEKVTNNRYYEKFSSFYNAVMDFLEKPDSWRKDASIRLKDNFQIIQSTTISP